MDAKLYKDILSHIVWNNYIDTKDGPSHFYKIIGEPTEWNRGDIYPKGMIMCTNPMILSFSIPTWKELSWSELALEIGLDVDRYVTDGHDCRKCPDEKECKAYFKYDVKQNKCNFWYTNVDNTIYKANIEKFSKNIDKIKYMY